MTGNIIKELRTKKGITQTELGKIIGVSKATIMKYEKGIIENLKRNHIEKMANYFNVSPLYILNLDDNASNKHYLDTSNMRHVQIPTYMEEVKKEYGESSVLLLDEFKKLNGSGKNKALDNIKDLTKIDEYTTVEKIKNSESSAG